MSAPLPLLSYLRNDIIEVGVDEAGRGPLFGRLYCGACIWNPSITNYSMIKDSKKFKSRQEREKAYNYVINNAVAWSSAFIEPAEIDDIGISKAWVKCMHEAISKLYIDPDHIIVDGNYFVSYKDSKDQIVDHTTVVAGDNKYISVASASIIAKVEHDRYIEHLCNQNPVLKSYGIDHNMGYGTKEHIDALIKYGATEFHRKTYIKKW